VAALGALLWSLREAAGWTQEELAERAGVSSRTISDTERGLRSRIYADTANRLAAALGLEGEGREAFLDSAKGRNRTGASSPGDIPHPLTALIGRESELAVLEAELSPASGRRLVTVTGLGGCGKTRLAVAAAERLAHSYDGRVRLVALAEVGEAARLDEVVAAALGTVPARIAAATTGRPTLLVLDAFEHVMPAAADLAAMLRGAADLHALVASRVRLRIPGERELALGPLPFDDAARLFTERASDMTSHPVDDPNLVDEICRLTNALPLPLELAAAHVRYLSLSLLRDQLVGGLSDASRVVQDAVAWSMSSLSEDERSVLARAAMFGGGWRLDALQAVCDEIDVVTAFEGLADRCLVVLADAEPVARWRMLDAVREAAASIELPTPDTRHAYQEFYARLLAEAGARVGDEKAWYRTLAAEEPNVRIALAWAEQDGDAEALLALATGMWLFWQSRGSLDEGRRWLSCGLSIQPAASPVMRMTALWGLAWLAYHQGDDDAAEAAGLQLAELAGHGTDDVATRNALTITGMVAIAQDRPVDAVNRLSEALEIARRVGQPWLLATSFLNLGLGYLAADDPGRARPLLAEALQRYDTIGDIRFRARCVGYLGLAALLEGDANRAKALFAQSLHAFRDLGDPTGIAEGLAGLASAEAQDRPALAAKLAGAANRVHDTAAARELPLERRVSAKHLAAAVESLGAAGWREAWEQGRAALTGDVVSEVLDSLGAEQSGQSRANG
jgi:predicted ATPase/DNA-binding XRE family transcriptional regulator